MWQGVHLITHYKPARAAFSTSKPSLHNRHNNFYTSFDKKNNNTWLKAAFPSDDLSLIRSIFTELLNY